MKRYVSWHRWRWWRFAYAPNQKDWQLGHGYHWRPIGFGLFFADFRDVCARQGGVLAQLRTTYCSAESYATVTNLFSEFLKAAEALQSIAAMGGDATDKEVADEALRVARLWRADDGHDALLTMARRAKGGRS